ncbi:hypothetical protein QZH41_019248 [Actinostola sp. cb2023]|nr:hypothetical protein QZH41_019248 [Actinostola sp. cb2023]
MSTPAENLPSFLRVTAQRKKHTIKDRDGEKFKLEAPTPNTLVYVQDCNNCECELERKAMKVIVEGCKDCVFNIRTSLLSGMMEFLKCENVILNIQENGMIWTLTVDGSNNVTVTAQKDEQFESIYIHHCKNIEVIVGTENPTRLPVIIDDPDRQYIIHWEKEGDTKTLSCEKVIRDGIYQTTEKALAEAIAKEKEFSEKMAIMMVDSIKVTQKPKKSKASGCCYTMSCISRYLHHRNPMAIQSHYDQ